jgi:hypothetical protein
MATSGTSTFTTTRDQLIRAAALEVSAIGLGVTMSAEMLSDFAFVLNGMIKHWQGRGLKIWTVREATLFPVAGQTRYGAGTGATDHIAESVTITALSADEAAGQTILSVDATTAMTNGDYLGIELDTGAIQWTTIVSKTSTTVTATAALTGAAGLGTKVYSYTSNIPKPIRVVDARRYVVTSAIETPIEIVSHKDYRHLPNKASVGSINQVQYDPQRVVGYFNLWSVPAAATELLKMTVWRPLDIFSAGGNEADLPEEWANALKWNLAKELMGRYPVNSERRRHITDMADSTLFDMEGYGREDESIFFQPNFRR